MYREWAPNALRAYLIGDFNNWDRDATPMTKNQFGVFEVTIPGRDGKAVIPHDSKLKARYPIPSSSQSLTISRFPLLFLMITHDRSGYLPG